MDPKPDQPHPLAQVPQQERNTQDHPTPEETTQAQKILASRPITEATTELNTATQQMKNQLLPHKSFTLYDSMAGIQIGDPKMDVKMNLGQIDSLTKLIASKKVPHPKNLTHAMVPNLL